MRVASKDAGGVVSGDTEFKFEHEGSVVSARYRGGEIIDGYLIGHLDGASLHFRYVQADVHRNLDAGVSHGTLERLSDGRLLLTENYTWLTRPGRGVNIFEEVREAEQATD